MKKRFLSIICLAVCAVLAAACFAGCGKETSKSGRLRVVATIFPCYDWAREIIGDDNDDIELVLLLGSGVDLHSYQPSVDDIMLISGCDVFVYVGGESDKWVTDALSQAQNKDMKVVKLMDALGGSARTEEAVEGMQEEAHGEHDDNGDNEGDEPEYDEHIWMSLKNASLCCDAIEAALSEAAPDKADAFKSRCGSYKEKLGALDGEYKAMMKEKAKTDTIVVGDRFPFRYLTEDYGLKYYAAFSGCSAETEASFETIVFLANKVDELKLGVVIKTEGSDGSVANTIKDNTKTADQKILTLDSLQSVTQEDIKGGMTYISAMKKNLEVLGEALGSVRK